MLRVDSITHLLLPVYIISIAFYTLFNNTGTIPASLVAALVLACLLFSKFIYHGLKVPVLSMLDKLLLCFLFVSIVSTIISKMQSTDLNINHLYAHLSVILLYYFSIRWAIYNSPYRNAPKKFSKVLYILLILMMAMLFADYLLLIQNINIADYLPLEKANRIAGSGFSRRPRGFFVEPTDLGLALNAIGPIVMVYLYISKKFTSFVVMLLLFLAGHFLIRSASAFAGLTIGVLVAGMDAVLRHLICIKLVYKKSTLTHVIILCLVLLVAFITFSDVIIENLTAMIAKVSFAENSASATNRYNAWSRTLSLFLNSHNPLYGNGTGYMSENHDSSHSWFLSVLIENGIIGILLLLLIVIFGLTTIFKIQSKVRYGLYVSFIAVLVHLATQTGFYFPFFWLLLVLIQYNWSATTQVSSEILTRIRSYGHYGA